jgi:hypothetical protein
MFEYINRKRDPVAVSFYCGCVPFAIIWVLHNSLWTSFMLEGYLITMGAFVINPFELQPQYVKERWFWKATLLGGAVVHPLFLAGLWFVDVTYPSFVTGTGTIFFVAIIVGGLESVVLSSIANRSRPHGCASL